MMSTKPTANTPAELILDLHRKHPQDTKDAACERFVYTVVGHKLFHEKLAEYYHQLRYNDLTQNKRARSKPTAEDKAHAEQVRRVALYRTLTLDVKMPNGKKLRDCTGAMLDGLEGICALIRTVVGPRQKVGSVLTNESLKELLTGKRKPKKS